MIITDTFGNQAEPYNISIKPKLLDCAHSFGLPFPSGYDAGVYSFAPAKTFTCGEGGVIVTNNRSLAKKMREHVVWGGRMQEVNGVIGLYHLENYKKILEEKKKIFDYYKLKLPFLQFQKINKSNYNVNDAMIQYFIYSC